MASVAAGAWEGGELPIHLCIRGIAPTLFWPKYDSDKATQNNYLDSCISTEIHVDKCLDYDVSQ